jgi:hypothetical protein
VDQLLGESHIVVRTQAVGGCQPARRLQLFGQDLCSLLRSQLAAVQNLLDTQIRLGCPMRHLQYGVAARGTQGTSRILVARNGVAVPE